MGTTLPKYGYFAMLGVSDPYDCEKMSDLEFKKHLYLKYKYTFSEEHLKKRLGLKDWEFDYVAGRGKFKRFEADEWIKKNSTSN